MEESKFLIITGMSGAGKTQVVRTLEDIAFYTAAAQERR